MLNRSFKVIFNHALGCFVAVAEYVKARGKSKSIKRADCQKNIDTQKTPHIHQFKLTALVLVLLTLGFSGHVSAADALCTGPTNQTTGGTDAVACGENANASGNSSVAIGESSNAAGNQSVAIGLNATTTQADAFALGEAAQADGENSLALGAESKTSSDYNISVGRKTKTEGIGAIALGGGDGAAGDPNDFKGAQALANGAIAIGGKGSNSIDGAIAQERYAISLGSGSNAEREYSVAIGAEANTRSDDSIAIGKQAVSGTSATVGESSISIGDNARVEDDNSIALGTSSSSTEKDAIAIGADASTTSDNAVAVGKNAVASVQDGIALGSNSNANRDAPTSSGYDASTGTSSTDTTSTWRATTAAVAVGDTSDTDPANWKTRQVTGVAAGSEDTDAVNVAQLKTVSNIANQGFTIAGSAATAATDAQIQPNDTLTIMGDVTNTDFTQSDAGKNIYTMVESDNTVSIGLAKDLQSINSVTLVNSTAPTQSSTLSSDTDGNLDVGGDKITNVATGTAATDAVNVQQLNDQLSATEKTSSVVGGTNVASVTSTTTGNNTEYTINAEGASVSAGSSVVTVSGTNNTTTNITDYEIDLSSDTKDDIQAGVDAKDAVDNQGLTFTGDTGTTDIETLGSTVAVNGDSNITTQATGDDINISLNENISLTSVTTGDSVLNDSGLTITGGPSVNKTGVDAGSQRITNVATGTAATDAVNVAQLDAVQSNFTNATFGITAEDGNTVANTVNNSVEVVGDSNNITTKVDAGKVVVRLSDSPEFGDITINDSGKITGLTNGDVSSTSKDAVNGSQLYETNQAISNMANVVNDLGYQIEENKQENEAGIAGAMAMAGMPQAFIPGKSMISGGIATYKGEGSVAVGMSRISDNGRWIYKFNGSADTKGNSGAAVGAGFHW